MSRDRHGPRGPLSWDATALAYRSERTSDLMVADLVSELIGHWPQVAAVELPWRDVPPSNPAAWESHNGRGPYFPADRRRGLRRIVVYRLPITPALPAVGAMTRRVLVERINILWRAARRDRRRDAVTARRH